MIEVLRLLDSNYCYIIHKNSTALIVDPGESSKVLEFLHNSNLRPLGILLTHNHNDHSSGVKKIKERYPKLEIMDYKSKILNFNDFKVEKILTPGHTKDSCCYLFPEENVLFTGDTLFTGLCGRLMEGCYKDFFNSLLRLKKLQGDTKIYPGHEYLKNSIEFIDSLGLNSSFYSGLKKNINPSLHSTIGLEIKNNPFMTEDFFRFKYLRELKG